MDEQRCPAPQISQNMGTPSTQRKDHPIPSPSLNRAKTDQHQQVRCYAAQYTAAQ